MTKALSDKISEVMAEFQRLEPENPRQAAELAYVLARLYKEADKRDLSEQYARRSIKLFEQVGVNTLEDAAAHYTVVADVCIPSYIHQDVVRQRFSEYHL